MVGGFLRLSTLCLSYTSISKDATILLFSQIASSGILKLRTLYMGRHPTNARDSHLPAVEPDIFATAICKLVHVEVDYNNLSFDQMSALFTKMTIFQHCLRSLTVSYDKRLKTLSESVVTQALVTVKSIQFHDLPQRYFNHFIENVKVTLGVKTRYVMTNWELRRIHQRMLEDALTQNVHINFIPRRMATEIEETEYETEDQQTNDDYDRVEQMENIQLSEENINDLTQMMVMQMMYDLGASNS